MKPNKTTPTPTPTITPVENISDDGLPAQPSRQPVDPQLFSYLFIAPPKFGKTTFFSHFPEALLLACEAGHKFVKCAKIVINSWDGGGTEHSVDENGELYMSFNEAVNRITKSDRYKFIVIDTIDALAKICSDHFLNKYKAETLKEIGEYGVGHDMGQNNPIRKTINKILLSGRGIGYTTHQDIIPPIEDKDPKKSRRLKKDCSMPNGLKKIILPQVDIILHGEYGGKRPPHKYRDRIIRTVGSEEILAGNRTEESIPNSFITPLDPEDAWKQFEGFFLDRKLVDVAEKEYYAYYE